MKRKKKLWIVIAILAIVVIGGYMFYNMMTAPMYEVGNVRQRVLSEELTIPNQTTENMWEVEDEIFLSYFSEGEGKPVLVIHGGPGIPYAESWTGLDNLTDNYEFYYYDQRGSGESTRPITEFASDNYYENALLAEETLGLTAQITDIERIRQILGEDKLTIIGHSYGGFLATLYAAEFPDNVEALVLVAPASVLKMPSNTKGLFDGLEDNFEGSELDEYNNFVKEYFDFKNTFAYDDDYYTKQNEQLGEYFYQALQDNNLSYIQSKRPGGVMIKSIYLSSGMRYDYTETIGELDIPTLIIHPNNDFVQSENGSRTYIDIFPDAKFVVLEKAGHMGFEDNPNEFYTIVKDFFDSVLK